MEAADWVGILVMYVPDFPSLLNFSCIPERPIKPGKQHTWIGNYIHISLWDMVINSCKATIKVRTRANNYIALLYVAHRVNYA